MECGKSWGSELEALSVDNWDFLDDERFKKIIAIEGGFENIHNASDTLKEMIQLYNRSWVLKENEEIISFNSLVSMHQVSLFIEKYDDTRISSVVELGAGLGNFSRIFRKYIETNHYTILDLPVMMKFSKKFLDAHGMKQEYIESDNFESLKGRIFSLFVSNICMSEMPKERCQGIIDVVWPNCKRLFIIDGHDEPFNSWLSGQIVKHFDKVQVFPYLKSMWKGQKVYVGQKL